MRLVLHPGQNYAMYTPAIVTSLQNAFYPSVGCAGNNATCQAALPLASIMSSQASLLNNAQLSRPSVAFVVSDYRTKGVCESEAKKCQETTTTERHTPKLQMTK